MNFPRVCECVSVCHRPCQSYGYDNRCLLVLVSLRVPGFGHIAVLLVCESHRGIWHERNVLTIGQVGTLASWGRAEDDGTGWELAVCPSRYMRARVTAGALCQIMGLSRGHCLSLGWYLERTRAGLDPQLLPAAPPPDTPASNKTASDRCVFVSVLMFVLSVRAHVQYLSEATSPPCDEGWPSVMWWLEPVTSPKSPSGLQLCNERPLSLENTLHWR